MGYEAGKASAVLYLNSFADDADYPQERHNREGRFPGVHDKPATARRAVLRRRRIALQILRSSARVKDEDAADQAEAREIERAPEDVE